MGITEKDLGKIRKKLGELKKIEEEVAENLLSQRKEVQDD